MEFKSFFEAKFYLKENELDSKGLEEFAQGLVALKGRMRFQSEVMEVNELLARVAELKRERVELSRIEDREKTLKRILANSGIGPYVNMIETACNVYDLRAAFKKSCHLFAKKELRDSLLKRVEFLRERCASRLEVTHLSYLEDEIEIELENGYMGNKRLNDLDSAKQDHLERKLEKEEALMKGIEAVGKEKWSVGEEETTKRKYFFLADFDASEEKDLWKRTERELIVKALRECNFNRTKTAEVLGISVRTLRNKLNDYAEQANCHASVMGKETVH